MARKNTCQEVVWKVLVVLVYNIRKMKVISIVFIIVILLVVIISGIFLYGKEDETGEITENQPLTIAKVTNIEKIGLMNLYSLAFGNNGFIPAKYTCDGENINPPLSISDVSQKARSLVLIMDDPDAPSGTWVHWTVWNIDPKTIEIVPQNAIEGTTSFGKPGYGGPCPPSGTHRYFFKLYALDNTLQLSASSTKEDLEKAMEGHIIGQTDLVGLYKR